jgi:hypothetical protein
MRDVINLKAVAANHFPTTLPQVGSVVMLLFLTRAEGVLEFECWGVVIN